MQRFVAGCVRCVHKSRYFSSKAAAVVGADVVDPLGKDMDTFLLTHELTHILPNSLTHSFTNSLLL
jgi:hypothetical protein